MFIGLDDFQNTSPDEMKHWLSSLENIINVPVLLSKNISNVYDETNVEPFQSTIKYVLQYHIYQVTPYLSKAFQEVLNTRSRRIHLFHQYLYVIHPLELEILFDDLLNYLKEQEIELSKGYTIFIMNIKPKLNKKYGYSDILTYSELRKMSNYILQPGSLYALNEYIFPLTEGYNNNNNDLSSASASNDVENTPRQSTTAEHNMNVQYDHTREYHYYHIQRKVIDIIDVREITMNWYMYKYPIFRQNHDKENIYSHIYNYNENHRSSNEYDIKDPILRQLYLVHNYYTQEQKHSLISMMRRTLIETYESYSMMTKSIEESTILSEVWRSKHSYSWIDISSGPFEWGPLFETTYLHSSQTLPSVPKEINNYLDMSEKELLLNYLTTLRTRLTHSCYSEFTEKCNKAIQQLNTILEEKNPKLSLQYYNNYFVYESYCQFYNTNNLGIHYKKFFSHLFESIYSYIGNSVLPHFYISQSTPDTFIQSTSSYITNRIHFRIYLVNDCLISYKSHTMNNDFDISLFQHTLLKTKLKNQQYIFTYKHIYLYDDSSLFLAFTSALTTTSILTVENNDHIKTSSIHYLNSKVLYQFLQNNDISIYNDTHSSSFLFSKYTSREIKIFIFQLDEEYALLFDKKYTSVSYNDIIFAIHSHSSTVQSEFLFDNHQLYFDLNDTMSSLLSSIYSSLTYIQPSYMRYNKFTHNIFYDWYVSMLFSDCIRTWLSTGYPEIIGTHVIQFSTFHYYQHILSNVILSLSKSIGMYNHAIVYMKWIWYHWIGPIIHNQ